MEGWLLADYRDHGGWLGPILLMGVTDPLGHQHFPALLHVPTVLLAAVALSICLVIFARAGHTWRLLIIFCTDALHRHYRRFTGPAEDSLPRPEARLLGQSHDLQAGHR